ncbi:MAG: FG-GAP repeat domain-containing protein, partial [Elainella sp.]
SRQYTWVEDFNNDGKSDIVTALGGNVYMHLSTRTGIETLSLTTPEICGDPGYNWPGDYNGDGFVDIASARPGGEMVIRLFDGQQFTLETWSATTPWGGSGYSWAKDFNNDGLTDIATALDSNLYLHLSEGDQFKTTTINSPGWGESSYNWPGDFNGDGLVDLASAFPGGTVKLRLFNGSGFDEENWSVSTGWGGGAYSWAGDFNGDSLTDLASAREGQIFLHLSDGQAFKTSTIATPNTWGEGRFNGTGDFNGDGRRDIASLPPGSNDVLMRLATQPTPSDPFLLEFDVAEWATTGYLRRR